jgi:hypothetical protein
MTTPNYRLIAAQRFLGANIYGTGQFAVVGCKADGGVKAVWLTASEDGAHAAALGSCHLSTGCQCNHAVLNLRPCPTAPRCKDRDYEDNRKYR